MAKIPKKGQQSECQGVTANDSFATFLRSCPICVQYFNSDGKLIEANRSCLDLFGVRDISEIAEKDLFRDFGLTEDLKLELSQGRLISVETTAEPPSKSAAASDHPPSDNLKRTIVPDFDGSQNTNRGFFVYTEIKAKPKNENATFSMAEKLYHDLVETSNSLVWQCDTEGRYIYLNKAWEKVMDYTVEEMLGRKFTDFQSPRWASQDAKLFETLLQGNSIQGYETVHQKKSGEDVHLVFNAKFLKDENGNPAGTSGFAYDITEKKHTAKILLESQSIYRRMVDHSPMGMHFYKIRGGDQLVFSDYNPSADRLLSVDNSQFIGKTIEEAFPPLAQTEIPERYKSAALDGIPWSAEQVLYDDDKISGAFEVHAFQTAPGEMVAVFIEITDRKRAEETAKAEKEKLAVTLRSIGDAVIATDIKGHVSLMNFAAERMTGLRFKDCQGKLLDSIVHLYDEKTREPRRNRVVEVMETGHIRTTKNHTVLARPTGEEQLITESGAPILDSNGNIIGIVLVFHDISEKQQLLEHVQKSQKLESIAVLAGGIAHDFNNLLGGIYGFLDMALSSSKDDKARRYVSHALSSMDRAKALTNQLLTFAKGGAPIKTIAPMPALVKEAVTFALSGTNVFTDFDIASDTWLCNVDTNQLAQVIDNIVINAQQAMPRGGCIKVKIENSPADKGTVLSDRNIDFVKITIQDEGVGIPENIISQIFDPFFTTKQKGSGLGLSTSYSIIKRHDGFIDVSSQPGKGTVFEIYLPACKETSEKSPADNTVEETGTGKVLVMDDEEFLRSLYSSMLCDLGYEAVCVVNGEEAIAEVSTAMQSSHPFDAVILDLTVPGGLGGKETAQRLRQLFPNIVSFVVSGYSNDPVMSDPQKYGITDCLSKPFRKNDLSKILKKHLPAPRA